jgi:hypothetical protein
VLPIPARPRLDRLFCPVLSPELCWLAGDFRGLISSQFRQDERTNGEEEKGTLL